MTRPSAPYEHILIDRPGDHLFRVTLNRPTKRNALNNVMRDEIYAALEDADRDPDVRVMILRGDGPAFCSGYDLASDREKDRPFYTAGGFGDWPRHVSEGAFRVWDLAKPVIAQVHGYCLAGGAELAASCDLVYVAEDAQIGYPAVRSISPPDNQFFPWLMGMRHAMEITLTGDSISGIQAAQMGFANRAFPLAELEAGVLEMASRVAKIPSDLQQINKRSVHRQMEIMGMRAGIRAGTELQALAVMTETTQTWMKQLMSRGVTTAVTARDERYGDYRTAGDPKTS